MSQLFWGLELVVPFFVGLLGLGIHELKFEDTLKFVEWFAVEGFGLEFLMCRPLLFLCLLQRVSPPSVAVLVVIGMLHTSVAIFALFPECVAKGSRLTLQVWGGALFATRCLSDRNRCQPFATVCNRPQ